MLDRFETQISAKFRIRTRCQADMAYGKPQNLMEIFLGPPPYLGQISL